MLLEEETGTGEAAVKFKQPDNDDDLRTTTGHVITNRQLFVFFCFFHAWLLKANTVKIICKGFIKTKTKDITYKTKIYHY